MNKQKIGLVIFWIGVALAVAMGGIASWNLTYTLRTLSFDEVKETVWAIPGFWFFLWAFAVPLGALLACVGMLLYVRAKALHIWLSGIGILVTLFIIMVPKGNHHPPLFGIGGILILIFFFAILWLWAKRRTTLDDSQKVAADLQVVAYVFLLIAMWFICGALGSLHHKAFLGDPHSSPIHIMIYSVLGWLFLFLGHYKSVQLKKSKSK